MRREFPNKGLVWASLVLGAGLTSAALISAEPSVAALNAGIVGSLIVCCSAVALNRYGVWIAWPNFVFGYWAVVAPTVLGFESSPIPMWTHVVVGLCVVAIATAQLTASRQSASGNHRRQVTE